MSTPARKPARQHVLTVEGTERLGPHLVRLVLGADSLADFAANGYTDAYVKLVFVDPALGLEPPYDLAALRQTLPAESRPVVRTYTVRWVDTVTRRLAIDFVLHGDAGVAGPWAAAAKPGDQLVVSGPGGAYAPDPDASWQVFAGDLSAVPAIAAALETLPDTAHGVAILEVAHAADIVPLETKATIDVHWLVNPDGQDAMFLARALDTADWLPSGEGPRVQVFAHGERESIRAVRGLLRDRGVPRESISISAYWARGRDEDVPVREARARRPYRVIGHATRVVETDT